LNKCVYGYVFAEEMRAISHAGIARREDAMPLLAELVGDPPPTPAAMPGTMRKDESFARKNHQPALWHHNGL
jgi:hypothetical protein